MNYIGEESNSLSKNRQVFSLLSKQLDQLSNMHMRAFICMYISCVFIGKF